MPQATSVPLHYRNAPSSVSCRLPDRPRCRSLSACLGQLLLSVAAVGPHHEGRLAVVFADVVERFLRQCEADEDRLYLGDRDEGGVVARTQKIAFIDEPRARASVDRRTNISVTEI